MKERKLYLLCSLTQMTDCVCTSFLTAKEMGVSATPCDTLVRNSVPFSCSVVSDSSTPWPAACQAYLSITNSWSLLKLMSIESVMPSNHLILCHPLLLPPSIFPSIRVFLNESVLCIKWPKYRSFSFGISPSLEYSGSISFRMDWLDLLAVQGTLKSLLQHYSSKASILASLVAQRLKHLPAMWETWVRSLGWEDPLEKEMATHSSILALRIPWMEELAGLQSTGSQRVGNDWATWLTSHSSILAWRIPWTV